MLNLFQHPKSERNLAHFRLAGGGNIDSGRRISGFTLAEILITLGIIGVVATLVIPAVIQNAQDAQYKTGKDKVRMSIAEAGRVLSVSGEIANASSAEDFVKNHLSKQLKIAKFCAPADMEKCGMPSGSITKLKKENGSILASMPITWAEMTIVNRLGTGSFPTSSYVFLSGDGIAVNLFYNPDCAYDSKDKNSDGKTEYYQLSVDTACVAGVYDMNGLKKPNQVGKDIGFFGVFYNGIESTAVAALPYKEGSGMKLWLEADTYCRALKGYKLPTIDELSALYLGRRMTTLADYGNRIWSASVMPGLAASSRSLNTDTGRRFWSNRMTNWDSVRCVRE